MLTKTIKTTGGNLKISIPSDRKEITIGMLKDLTPEPGHSYSPLEVLSKLSGIAKGDKEFDGRDLKDDEISLLDIEDLASLEIFDEAISLITYQLKAFQEVQEIPDHVTLQVTENHSKKWFNYRGVSGVKTISVIKNLGIAPAGAYMEAKQVIKREYDEWERIKKEYGDHIEFNPSIHSLIRLLSLYFYCPATGEKFNTLRVVEFDKVIERLKITEALPIARYFFLKYPNLSKPKVKPSLANMKKLISGQV